MRVLDPKRTKYKKTFNDKGKCPFCGKDDLECEGLAGKHWKVLMNRYPYMDGNVMVVPSRHIEKIEDITKEEWEDFGMVLAKTKKVLGKIFKTDSFNIGLNLGPESGASIPHLHWQVVPRKFKNITVMNTFADLYLVATTAQEAKKMIEDFVRKNK